MANLAKILPANVPGELFVDTTCIDCDTCRQLAPQVFGETDGYSFVQPQPADDADDERGRCRRCVSCPTGSIGTRGANRRQSGACADFPLPIEGDVYLLRLHLAQVVSAAAATSSATPAGNWLIDSPKFLPQLVSQSSKQLGGLRHIFLTHRDDVADADRYAAPFRRRRIIHRAGTGVSARRRAESGRRMQPMELAPGFVAIPTPGHTAGHMVLLARRPLSLHRRPLGLGPRRAAAGRLPQTTAGTPGPRQTRVDGPPARLSNSNGSCPATASGSICPPIPCAARLAALVERMRVIRDEHTAGANCGAYPSDRNVSATVM